MKNKNEGQKNSQLILNFEILENKKEFIFSKSEINNTKINNSKVISINQYKKIEENELRNFVINNTKSF